MKKIIALISIMAISISIIAQDNITVLQYNLLYYGADEYDCNQTNNNIGNKTNYLKTLISYVEPDIFAVNEISVETSTQDYLLYNVFTLNGYPNYERGTITDGDQIMPQIFYNSHKLTLVDQEKIYSSPRKIFAYKFYYNSPDLASGSDTIFFTYFIAHLKASNTSEDIDKRVTSANNLMEYIYNHQPTNYIFSGDLNFYTSTEEAYQILTSYSIPSQNFIDPTYPDGVGNWHDNETYSDYHTQSTFHSSTTNPCPITGGLDDRFDYILFNNSINSGTDGIEYNNNSFTTIGQDGEHFNSSIDWNGNNSVPASILTVLTNCSDHLPIMAEFTINQTPARITLIQQHSVKISTNNPVKEELKINIYDNDLIYSNIKAKIYDITGREVTEFEISTNTKTIEYSHNISQIDRGTYIIKFSNEKGFIESKKIIKQ